MILCSCTKYTGDKESTKYDRIEIYFDGNSKDFSISQDIRISVSDSVDIENLNELNLESYQGGTGQSTHHMEIRYNNSLPTLNLKNFYTTRNYEGSKGEIVIRNNESLKSINFNTSQDLEAIINIYDNPFLEEINFTSLVNVNSGFIRASNNQNLKKINLYI